MSGRLLLASNSLSAPPALSPDVGMIVSIGQSNELSIAVQEPQVAVFSQVPFWLNQGAGVVDYSGPHLLGPSPSGPSGWEIAAGQYLWGQGKRVGIVKLAKGDSFMNQMTPGGAIFDSWTVTLNRVISQLEQTFPGMSNVTWFGGVNQGEEEVRNPSESPSINWGDNFDLVKDGIEAITEQPMLWQCVLTSNVAGALWLATLNATQTTHSDAQIPTNDAVYQTDNVHFTYGYQSILGQRRGEAYEEWL